MEVTSVKVYYNDNSGYCCDWISNMIDAGVLTPGKVDNGSIEDVTPNDLEGYDRCHFFAGLGLWEYAILQSGLGAYRDIWTGSCPCQPFSEIGKGEGFADERHLWPAWFHLIEVRRPAAILGEQVASKDGLAWLDLISADLEGTGYAIGPGDYCAAGFGSPNIRQRQYIAACGVGDGIGEGLEGHAGYGYHPSGWAIPRRSATAPSITPAVAHRADRECGPVNGFWRDADWLKGRDDIWRPVQPGTFPMADGYPERVEQIRAYGNAINAQQAIEFCGAFREFIELVESGV